MNLLIIIPLHEYNENVSVLLNNAIKSVDTKFDIVISTTSKIYENNVDTFSNYSNIVNRDVKFVYNTENSSFQSLINNAIDSNYDWFSILEFDDEYSPIWFDNVSNELEYNSSVSVFLPLVDIIDFNKKNFLMYGNDAPWASSFSNEIGYIDNESLQQFFDYNLTGSVFNTQDWINCGGLKESMKLVFWYEFLLRLTNNNKKVYVIPKVGYKHYVNRENSLFDEYKKTMTQEESDWWYNTAREEYLYKEDRHKIYNK